MINNINSEYLKEIKKFLYMDVSTIFCNFIHPMNYGKPVDNKKYLNNYQN